MRLFSTAQASFSFPSNEAVIDIPSVDRGRIYLTWQPVEATARIKTPDGGKVSITLTNAGASGGGEVRFGASRKTANQKDLTLELHGDGTPVTFWVAGERASSEDGDAGIVAKAGGKVVASVPLMVRIRKNAEKLSLRERRRFLTALAKLNSGATGGYMELRRIHGEGMDAEAHHRPGFLPWHRAYLLDLERELQAVDPSVALPYWRFDEAAPTLFTRQYLGASSALGLLRVRFALNNPLHGWKTDHPGILRKPMRGWNPLLAKSPRIAADFVTLDPARNTYAVFRQNMEFNPHDRAHVSWIGDLYDVPTAPQDPLFFLLHCNVDRIWAEWQKADRAKRTDTTQPEAYNPTPQNGPPLRLGHELDDDMWPWNGLSGGMRPAPPNPGGNLASSPITMAPPSQPTVRDLIDYQGIYNSPTTHQGFDYDDVKFEAAP